MVYLRECIDYCGKNKRNRAQGFIWRRASPGVWPRSLSRDLMARCKVFVFLSGPKATPHERTEITKLSTLNEDEQITTTRPWSKYQTTLSTSDKRQHENATATPWSKYQTTLSTSDKRQHENATATPWSKYQTTLSTSDKRQHENATATPWSKYRATQNATATPWSKYQTTLTTSEKRQPETSTATPWSKYRATLSTSVNRQYETTTTTPSSKYRTTVSTATDTSKLPTKFTTLDQSKHTITNISLNVGENEEKQDNRRRYVGVIKQDHFIVLVSVLIIVALIILCTIMNFIRRLRYPQTEKQTCAAYFLMSSSEAIFNRQQEPQNIQLVLLTS